MKTFAPEFHSKASVRYQRQIINPDGSIAFKSEWKNNLILDQGLNNHATTTWGQLFASGAVGTGTDPVKRDSSTTTFSRAGTTVTASANFFVSGDVGRVLKFDSGEEMYITAFTDDTHVTVNTSGTIAASEGTIWYVNQIGLVTETKRTTTYSTNGGDNQTTFSVDTATMKRTYLFSAESGPVTYREIGWSHSGSAGNNLFGRDLIPGVGDSLVAGQQYKVVIQLLVSFSPTTPGAQADVGNNGFNTSGTIFLESVGKSSAIASNGGVVRLNGSGGTAIIEPSGMNSIYYATANWTQRSALTTSSFSVPAGVVKSATAAAYTNGTFYRDFTSDVVSVSEGNGSIYGLLIGNSGDGWDVSLKFTSPQTKDSDHTISSVWRVSWSRVLSNL